MNPLAWTTRPNGDIVAQPLAGWSTAILPMAGLVKLDYFPDAEALSEMRLSAVQLAASGPQLRELAQALLRMADQIEAQPLGTRQ